MDQPHLCLSFPSCESRTVTLALPSSWVLQMVGQYHWCENALHTMKQNIAG